MDRKSLGEIEREIGHYRRSEPTATDLESLAQKLGRQKVIRGEVTYWESTMFDNLPSFPIPNLDGKKLLKSVKNIILSHLEDDYSAWDDFLTEQHRNAAKGKSEAELDENGADDEPGE
ncbi:MAG: hypothetical protein ABSC26_13335 [Stellaceae bacterium]|jgi:hypothetical protein